MSIENVRAYFKRFGLADGIIEMNSSTATVAEAATALGVEGARIAKSISLKNGDGAMLVITAGDMKIDNKKFRHEFGFKARMLSPDEALSATGHAVGGVCPFALPVGVDVFLDGSLRRFTTVFPACGSSNSAIELSIPQLEQFANNKKWVDVCKG
jgi:prolyl-tRNA editing enzyme YbaK/EbsC (Cys-tRNA(Pro) deacylase)